LKEEATTFFFHRKKEGEEIKETELDHFNFPFTGSDFHSVLSNELQESPPKKTTTKEIKEKRITRGSLKSQVVPDSPPKKRKKKKASTPKKKVKTKAKEIESEDSFSEAEAQLDLRSSSRAPERASTPQTTLQTTAPQTAPQATVAPSDPVQKLASLLTSILESKTAGTKKICVS
jgi:hypothetical protein